MSVSSEYITLSQQPSDTTVEKQDQLIILDLNGTLCSRKKRGKKVTSTFYTRPHCKAFFDYIFKNYTVMVWSSAQTHSVNNMCTMFSPYKPGLTWDRSHLNLSKEEFHGNPETVKDLDLVWQISSDFNAKNTIILDDSIYKSALQPYNLMHMSTFDHATFKKDNDLLKVVAYLKILSYQTNVANYMRDNPFDFKLTYDVKLNPQQDVYFGIYQQGKWTNPPTATEPLKKPNKKQRLREKRERESRKSLINPAPNPQNSSSNTISQALKKDVSTNIPMPKESSKNHDNNSKIPIQELSKKAKKKKSENGDNSNKIPIQESSKKIKKKRKSRKKRDKLKFLRKL